MRAGAGIGLIVALVAGCGWFETRDPLPFEPIEPVPRVSPIEPELVLANMDSALVYLGRGIDNYVRCLGDTFHFYPHLNDQVVWEQQGKPNAYENWDRNVEREVMDLILSSAKEVDVTFSDRNVVADTEDYKIWEQHYVLEISKTDTVETYEGVARLELRTDPSQANQWFITNWQTYEWPGQTAKTWGWLRGLRRQI